MTHDSLSNFAQTWGLLYFMFLFCAALAYAVWPSNGQKFDEAAQLPLSDKEPLDE